MPSVISLIKFKVLSRGGVYLYIVYHKPLQFPSEHNFNINILSAYNFITGKRQVYGVIFQVCVLSGKLAGIIRLKLSEHYINLSSLYKNNFYMFCFRYILKHYYACVAVLKHVANYNFAL